MLGIAAGTQKKLPDLRRPGASSSRATAQEDFRACAAEASSYLIKPVRIEELVAKINEATGGEAGGERGA